MIIAIDYGRRRVGFATSTSSIVASPHKILVIKTSPFKEILDELKTFSKITTIYIGLPLHMDGNHSEMSLEVLKLKDFLSNNLEAKIELVDERLTSNFATNNNTKKKKNIDDIVATEMLNNILASKKS